MDQRIKTMPIIIKKGNIAYLQQRKVQKFRDVKVVGPIIKDIVIYETKSDNNFLEGKYQSLKVINQYNSVLKVYRTVAKYFSHDGSVLEKTSDSIIELIGHEKYKTVFTGICSIIDDQLKIRSILALLSEPKVLKKEVVSNEEKCCQTDEIRIINMKQPKRIKKRRLQPYIVQESPLPNLNVIVDIQPVNTDNDKCNKIIKNVKIEENDTLNNESETRIDPLNTKDETIMDSSNTEDETQIISMPVTDLEKSTLNNNLPELGHLDDDNSNDSVGCLSLRSIETTDQLLTDPLSILNNIDQHTQNSVKTEPFHKVKEETKNPIDNTTHILSTNQNTNITIETNGHRLKMRDGNRIVELVLPCKPQDDLHIATKENMQHLNECERRLLIKYQMTLDFKHCLTTLDEDFNLPIHLAVLSDDFELVKRLCIVLNLRKHGVDVLTKNDLTPLKMSLYRETVTSTHILLQNGADVLRVDAGHRTPVHCAAELPTDHLAVLLNHCRSDARKILTHSDIMRPEWEEKTDEEMERILLDHICCMADDQGYTPLMLATRLGEYENVRTLLQACPTAVDCKMPTTGNTALYLACVAATDCSSDNHSKVPDKFEKTINSLMEYNADPSLENLSGASVTTLLNENNLTALSILISNKFTKTFQYDLTPELKDVAKMMLVKGENGKIDLKRLHPKKQKGKHVTILHDVLLKHLPKNIYNERCSKKSDDNAGKVTVTGKSAGSEMSTSNVVKTVRKIIMLPPKRKIVMPQKNAKKNKI